MTRHFLRDDDLSPAEQAEVLALAAAMKADRQGFRPLAGPRTVALMFDKPSLRTRVSFSVGVAELGGIPLEIDTTKTHIGRGETDRRHRPGAHPAGRRDHLAHLRPGADRRAGRGEHGPGDQHADRRVPPLPDPGRPADGDRASGPPAGRTLTYVGDGANNMAHSYLLGGVTAGMHVRVASPPGYQPDPVIVARAQEIGAATGGSAQVLDDAALAAKGADVLATDVWVSMGMANAPERTAALAPFQVNGELLAQAAPGAIVLHCLPAHRGEEITAEVLDGPASVVWDQAENRLHAQKALLAWLLEQPR